MVDYKDEDGNLIISVILNKDHEVVRVCFQPESFMEMIKKCGGEASVQTGKFIMEGDGVLMATLANQLEGSRAIPTRSPGPSFYPQQPSMYQSLPKRSIKQVTDDDDIDDDDTDDDDIDDDDETDGT